MRAKATLLLTGLLLLPGCAGTSRRMAPPRLISDAAPDGYPPTIRLVTTDLRAFVRRSPGFFRGIREAATDGSVDVLALSGGGSGGAFGAGALVGLGRAHARPQFELVTGVSVGALIAPFAFLGPSWDDPLRQAFSGRSSADLTAGLGLRIVQRLLSPLGSRRADPLFRLVDHYVTPEMIAAVARANARGRRLLVATTDLDKEEAVLWNMGAIAARGGEPARRLFRDVLIASASVPGIFPPVVIHVREGQHRYDELHVDGSVTTPVFTMPLVAGLRQAGLSQLHDAHLYMIIDGRLARPPRTTPIDTLSLLSRSFSADMTYKTREAVLETIGSARHLGMQFRMTEIPADYPLKSFVDFEPESMRMLFDYAAACAEQGLLWMTPDESLARNMAVRRAAASSPPACPAVPPRPAH